MRIGFDARCVYRGMGGIGRYASSLLAELSRSDRRHEYVCYFTPLERPEGLRLPSDTRSRTVEAGMIDERFDHLVLPGMLEEDGIQVYFNPTFASPLVRGHRVRTVATVHDVVFRRHPALVPEGLRTYLDRATDASCRTADLVLTGSEFSKKEILSLYPTPKAEITVIPHGIHGSQGAGQYSPDFLNRSRLAPDRYVLYVGSIEPKKNIVILIKAFARFLRRFPDSQYSLVLAGSHDRSSFPLDAVIDSENLRDRVRLLGYVSEEELEALYAFASMFVYPSLYEGFGLPPLEAMARGVATIVADTSSLSEVVGDGALLVAPSPSDELAQAMCSFYADRPLRERLRSRGRARAAAFSWKQSAERHIAAFEQALEQS